ncbi:hypothetical protein PoB_005872600 [Plakobranchus ocellatus]|uniref:Uncharacterized protein n=1 Tax=Plakobranchus ocellatus TaxID=259542 RepID=A0AAV4CKT2_9GAST|nr:hypothetical protein PoB_005872600 [Plakobranchus ocellatus]
MPLTKLCRELRPEVPMCPTPKSNLGQSRKDNSKRIQNICLLFDIENSPQRDDLRLSCSPSDHGAGAGTRPCDRRVSTDTRADAIHCVIDALL